MYATASPAWSEAVTNPSRIDVKRENLFISSDVYQDIVMSSTSNFDMNAVIKWPSFSENGLMVYGTLVLRRFQVVVQFVWSLDEVIDLLG